MRRTLAFACLLGLGACAVPQPGVEAHYVVFFTEWSALLDSSAKDVVTEAAEAAKAAPGLKVTVIGFADQLGSQRANLDISAARAQVVSDELVADGVAPASIQRKAAGATPHAALSAQVSRRVEVVIAP